MLEYRATFRVARTPAEVFDVIGTRCYENHPRWEPEVIEIRPLIPGPIGLGSRAVMVRRELGRRSEATYEVTVFEPGCRIAFRHLDGPMGFELSFDLRPAGASDTDLEVCVRMQPMGALRLLSPLLAFQLPGRSERITRRMIALVEAARVDAPGTLLPA